MFHVKHRRAPHSPQQDVIIELATVIAASCGPEFDADHSSQSERRVLHRGGDGQRLPVDRGAMPTQTHPRMSMQAHCVACRGMAKAIPEVLRMAAKLLGGRRCPGALCGGTSGCRATGVTRFESRDVSRETWWVIARIRLDFPAQRVGAPFPRTRLQAATGWERCAAAD